MRKPPEINLPFKVEARLPFTKGNDESIEQKAITRQQLWLEQIKRQARENLNIETEYLRISWVNRYKIPMHKDFGDYTPEEMLLEAWEQFYYEHPDHLEMKNIFKRKNPKTGYAYYKTGDPVLDELEEAFGRGETPDLSIIDVAPGPDIFRSAVFQSNDGRVIRPRTGLQGVQENEKGEKITVAGAKVEHENFQSSDDWVKEMLKGDPTLQMLAEKTGMSDA